MQYLSERLLATKTARQGAGTEGRHDAVATEQRRRLLAATERLLAERGCAGTTIERIAKEARVSSITFYDHFGSKEEAFAAAFERAVEQERAGLAAAVPPELPWPERVRAALRALLAAIAADPARARVLLVETQRGGPGLLAHYEAVLDLAAARLCEGRELVEGGEELPPTQEEATAAGIAWLLRERLEAEGAEGIEELLPRLLEIALSPYLGSAG